MKDFVLGVGAVFLFLLGVAILLGMVGGIWFLITLG